jgi:hypothetical protein
VHRGRAAAGVAAAAAAAALASAALATSVPDRDDVSAGIDIARASGSHNRATDKLVHTIDAYAAFAPADMVNKDRPPSSICVEIWTTNTPGERQPNYEACATPDAKGKAWKAALSRNRQKGPPLRIATLTVEQPADTRLVMRIDPDDIHRPASYRWRVETTDFGSDCKITTGCPDYAPDRPDTALTRLGTPRH